MFILYQKEMAGKWAVGEKRNKVNNKAAKDFIYSLALQEIKKSEVNNWISGSIRKLKVTKWVSRLMEINGSILHRSGRKPFLVFLQYLFNLYIGTEELE